MDPWTPHDLPLVGRGAERRLIRDAVASGREPGALVAGVAGVGKTRLVQEVAVELETRGWRVLTARPTSSGAGLPLAALAGMLPPPDAVFPPASPVQRAVLGIRELVAGARTVLVVDDAHLLDEASAAAIHQVVAERTLPVLGTVRTDGVPPGAVSALWKDAGVRRLDLRPLGPPEVDELVAAMLGGPVDGATLYELRRASEGNPLLLRELLASAGESGALEQTGGLWQLTRPLDEVPRLSELLRDRVGTSEPGEREALELLAIGQPLPLRVIAELVGEDVLERLERRGLISVIAAGARPAVCLSHPLYAEVLGADVPALARMRHSRRLAAALERSDTSLGDEAMRAAMLRLDGGGQLDATVMLAAAEQAAVVREYALSERLSVAAYEAGGGVAAGLVAARARFQLGRLDAGLALCRDLHRIAETDAERTGVAVEWASELAHGADDVSGALRALDEAGVTDGASSQLLDAFRLSLRSYQLDCSVVDEAIALFRHGDSATARITASGAACTALMLAGRYADCVDLADETLAAVARQAGPERMYADAMPIGIADLRCHLPDPQGAATMVEVAYEATLHPTDPVNRALVAFGRARLELVRGRPASSLRWGSEAFLVADHLGMIPVCRWAAGVRLQAASQLARADEAERAARDVERHAGSEAANRLFDIDVARGIAWRAASEGDAATVRHELGAAVARHGQIGAIGSATLGALDLVRLGEAALAYSLLADCPPPAGWLLGQATVDYAAAAQAGDGAGLERLARDFAGYGMPLHAAESAVLAASAWQAAGRPSAAARARLLADSALAGCEGAVTPALRLGSHVAQLTRRERELALTAAGGEPTREIAKRLHLSERTVENHLHRAYSKLGVSGRAELRSMLARGV